MLAQIKSFIAHHQQELYIIVVLVLVAVLAFGLGRLSVFYGEQGEFKVVYPEASAEVQI